MADYDPSFFVNRDQEIEPILEAANKLLAGRTVGGRVFRFAAHSGYGNTWLAHHLHTLLCTMGGVFVYIPQYMAVDHGPLPTTVREILLDMVDCIRLAGGTIPIAARAVGATDQFISQLISDCLHNDLGQKKVCVFIFDRLKEFPKGLHKDLDVRFLEPVSNHSRSLLVLTADDTLSDWSISRLRVTAESLRPFDACKVKEVLHKQFPLKEHLSERIYSLSQGIPAEIARLARLPDGQNLRQPDDVFTQKIYNLTTAALAPRLFSAATALSVLAMGFSDNKDEVGRLLELIDGGTNEWNEQTIVRLVRVELGDAQVNSVRVLKWNQSDYYMDPSIREALEWGVFRSYPDQWRGLHEAALDIYRGFILNFPYAESQKYQGKMDYHRQCLEYGRPKPVLTTQHSQEAHDDQ